MPEPWLWIPIACIIVAAVMLFLWRPFLTAARDARLAQARKGFHKQREWLEAKFLRLASTGSGGDAPRWADCDFDDSVAYVRNRSTRELSAFVAVTLAMEGVSQHVTSATELIGNLRAGTAVFRFEKDHWVTDGRVILNLSPAEAIRFYHNDFEMVGQELADRPI